MNQTDTDALKYKLFWQKDELFHQNLKNGTII